MNGTEQSGGIDGQPNQGTHDQQPQEVTATPPASSGPREHFLDQFKDEGLSETATSKLTEFYDRQQADYTRKTMELAKKAKLVEEVLNNPEKLSALQQLYGQSAPAAPAKPEPYVPSVDYREVLEPDALSAIEAFFEERIVAAAQRFGLDTLPDRLKVFEQERASTQLDQVFSKYPAAASIREDPVKFQQLNQFVSAGIPLEQAVMALAGEDIAAQRVAQALKEATPPPEPADERKQQYRSLVRPNAPVSQTSGGGSIRDRAMGAYREMRG